MGSKLRVVHQLSGWTESVDEIKGSTVLGSFDKFAVVHAVDHDLIGFREK